jgi:hypothetical protein
MGIATAEASHPQLFEKIASHIVSSRDLSSFQPQNLSNIVWAFATAEASHPQLFEKVANHIESSRDLSSFILQDYANIIWAFATAEALHPQLFEKVAKHIESSRDLASFIPQDYANIVWAYATAEASHPQLFEKVANHIESSRDLSSFIPQDYANIVWAYATAELSHPVLFSNVADSAIQRQSEFNSQDITNLLWAFASNGDIERNLYTKVAPSASKLTSQYTCQQLTNIAWAYAVADVDAPTLFNDNFIEKCNKKMDAFSVESLMQLYQWYLWRAKEHSEEGLPQMLHEKCYNVFVSASASPSALQDDVVVELRAIGLHPEEEVLLQSGYRIDALVQVNGENFVIEVDGPSHFIGKIRDLKGSTKLKHRQVSIIDGIPIVSVPYWEWNKLRKDRKKKQKYLRSRLGLAESTESKDEKKQ